MPRLRSRAARRNSLDSRKLAVVDLPAPPPPAPGEVQVRIKAVALNHIDVWGWRGMAFAKRKLPLVIGAEAAGEVEAVGDGRRRPRPGQTRRASSARETCGLCRACREGRDNLCENVSGVRGFHLDGLRAKDQPAGAPAGPCAAPASMRSARRCAPVTFGTVEHMLFDNAKLEPGETILVHAGGTGIGTAAIQLAKAAGSTVITTVGCDDKIDKAKALGADHVINYREDRFEGVVRKLTKKRASTSCSSMSAPDTFPGSHVLPEARRPLVTCGSTSGVSPRSTCSSSSSSSSG